MKVVGVRAGEVVGLEAFDVLGLDDEDVFAGLKFAGDLEEVFLCNDKPQLFKKLGFPFAVPGRCRQMTLPAILMICPSLPRGRSTARQISFN